MHAALAEDLADRTLGRGSSRCSTSDATGIARRRYPYVTQPPDGSDSPWLRDTATHQEAPTSHAHAEEARDGPHMSGSFPHEKLEAYQVGLKMATLAKEVAAQIPRGYRNVADHLLRAASNTVLLLAEGANRRGAGEKRQRFVESRGECGEVGAAGDLLLVYDIGSRANVETLKRLASRVSAMLTRLIERLDTAGP